MVYYTIIIIRNPQNSSIGNYKLRPSIVQAKQLKTAQPRNTVTQAQMLRKSPREHATDYGFRI